MTTNYEVLGVEPHATDAEIAAAYKSLAKQFHPDQHPEATPAAKAQWQQAMASINNAYEVLKDPARRSAYDATLVPQRPVEDAMPGPQRRPPYVGECDLCGSGPAGQVEFRTQNAVLFRYKTYTTRLELCRNCAQAVGRAAQSRTLWSGWLGTIAPLMNLGHVIHNARELHRVRRWRAPQRDPLVAAPMSAPLSPGRGVFGRFGTWVPIAVLLLILGNVLKTHDEASPPTRTSPFTLPPATLSSSETWRVGACVSVIGQSASPVRCTVPHDGKIVLFVRSSQFCPATAEKFVSDTTGVWCIDLDA